VRAHGHVPRRGVALACALALALAVAPSPAWAVAPLTTISLDSSPEASGWFIVAPWVMATPDQAGVLHWWWDTSTEQTSAVLAGADLFLGVAPEGEHIIHAYTVNGALETESPGAFLSIKVDSVEPSQPGSFEGTVTHNVGVELEWAASSDAGGSGVDRYTVYRKLGAPPFSPTDILWTGGALSYLDVPPDDGTYAYAVSAWDVAGNESAFSETTIGYYDFAILLPIYRFYNFRQGVHFYTASEAEKNAVVGGLSSIYRLEGVAYSVNIANPANGTSLYRFYNFRQGVHFYTASEAEKDDVVRTLSSTYRLEGVAYKVSLSSAGGATPVYRFYNTRQGVHFYTSSEAEKDDVVRTLSSTYRLEGVAYYLAP
jgi:hypothetical protein